MDGRDFLVGELNRTKAKLYNLKSFAKDINSIEWIGYVAGIEDAVMHIDEAIERLREYERNTDRG